MKPHAIRENGAIHLIVAIGGSLYLTLFASASTRDTVPAWNRLYCEESLEPSAAVRAFINAYIESIDVLRVLLLLARHPDRAWTASEVGQATALAVEVVRNQLPRLVSMGLVTAVDSADPTYQYAPRAEEFDQMVQELIQLDEQMPVTLIRLVYSRTSGSVQAFADAFRLRRP